jgi:hypothetical protein
VTTQFSCFPRSPHHWRCTTGASTLLADTGLIDDAKGAQVVRRQAGHCPADVALQKVADPGEGPLMVMEELLHGADGDASVQGEGFTGLAVEVGEQAAEVEAHQVKGLGVATTEQELLQVIREGLAQSLNFFGRHGNPSGAVPEVRHAICAPLS